MRYFYAQLPKRFGCYGFEGGSRCALAGKTVHFRLRIHATTDSYQQFAADKIRQHASELRAAPDAVQFQPQNYDAISLRD